MNANEIILFARKFGYDGAEHYRRWKGFDVYRPIVKNQRVANIGKPEFILVSGDMIRMATEVESFEFIDSLPDENL